MADFHALLDRLAAGWTARDYDAVAACFSEGVLYLDPVRYVLRGRPALRAFFEDDGGSSQRTTWRNVLFDEARQMGVAEYTYEGTHRYHGTVWIRLENDRIARWREYQHVDPRGWEEFAGEEGPPWP